jgi:hypothetical protein
MLTAHATVGGPLKLAAIAAPLTREKIFRRLP